MKYLAHAPALGRGPLSTRALTVWEQANGTCVLVHPAGLEPACPWATPFEGVVYPGSTTDACSPCLLVKGTDCAGVARAYGMGSVAPAYGRGSDSGLCVFCFSVLMGRSNTLTSPSGPARSFAGED